MHDGLALGLQSEKHRVSLRGGGRRKLVAIPLHQNKTRRASHNLARFGGPLASAPFPVVERLGGGRVQMARLNAQNGV